jgi:hypothetical protein
MKHILLAYKKWAAGSPRTARLCTSLKDRTKLEPRETPPHVG